MTLAKTVRAVKKRLAEDEPHAKYLTVDWR